MKKEDLYSLFFKFLEENNGDLEQAKKELNPALSLIQQGFIDSMAMIGLLLSLEEKSGISVDFGSLDAETVVTMNGLEQLFCKK